MNTEDVLLKKELEYPDELNSMLALESDAEKEQVAKAWANFQEMFKDATKKPERKKDSSKKSKAKQAKASRKRNRK